MQPESIAAKNRQKTNVNPFRGNNGMRVICVPPFWVIGNTDPLPANGDITQLSAV
jgi:hypothetical protein